MAVKGELYKDIVDALKESSSDDDLVAGEVIELLRETNAVLEDAQAVPCNLGVRHRTITRTGLPSVAWGKLYQGITQSKSATQQVEDTTGFLEALADIDKRLLDLYSNPDEARLAESRAFLEALNQEMASVLFYGDSSVDPEKFTGLAPRFSSLSAGTGGQIVSAAGAGSDNTSIWFIDWHPQACQLLYPAHTAAGIVREDKGEQRVLDDNNLPFYVMEDLYRWHCGLTVRDWRRLARVANIDVSNMQAGSVDMFAYMRKAYWKRNRHRGEGGRQVIYCNSDVMEALDAQSTPTTGTSASYVRLRPMEVDGFEVMGYRGMPLRQVDAILNTESAVS